MIDITGKFLNTTIVQELNETQFDKAKAELKKIIEHDSTSKKLQEKSKANDRFISDYLDYMLVKYDSQFNRIMTKYNMDYDELAQLIMDIE